VPARPDEERDIDIEMGAVPRGRRQHSSWYGLGDRERRGDRRVMRGREWWRVCCSVKVGVVVSIVVGVWMLIILGASGRMRTA